MKPSEIKIGDVFRITMNKANGITPKPGDNSRDKFFVFLALMGTEMFMVVLFSIPMSI